MRHVAAALTLVFAVVLTAGSGPGVEAKSRTPVASAAKQLRMDPRELRIRVRALIRPTLGIVEEAADRSLSEVADPQVRRGLLVWKIETTTTLLSAMLRSDPLLALADAWAYAYQQANLFARPEVVATYGSAAAEGAAAAATTVQDKFRAFLHDLDTGIDLENLERQVRQWAERNPIEGALYRRPAADTAVAELLASSRGGGTFAALGSLEETTADVMTRMDLYTMYLPRLARWEAELGVDDLTRGTATDQLMADLERFARAADRIAALSDAAPALIDGQRLATLESLRAERMAATQDLSSERRAVLEALHQERVATVADVEAVSQRLVDRARGPLDEAVRADLQELLQSVEMMRQRLMRDVAPTLDAVVDHAFVRAVQLLLIAAVLGAAGMWGYARFLRA